MIEIEAELLDRIIEEELWLIVIKCGSVIEYTNRISLKLSPGSLRLTMVQIYRSGEIYLLPGVHR
jgi:hypothetical protein